MSDRGIVFGMSGRGRTELKTAPMNNDPSRSDPSTDREGLQLNWRDEGRVTGSVIAAIAALTGTPPAKLQPLYETIDPDALERVLESASDPCRRSTLSISFPYEGCEVTIRADGRLDVSTHTGDL